LMSVSSTLNTRLGWKLCLTAGPQADRKTLTHSVGWMVLLWLLIFAQEPSDLVEDDAW
jgi:hypothetical protein